jgi:hypothetical protein
MMLSLLCFLSSSLYLDDSMLFGLRGMPIPVVLFFSFRVYKTHSVWIVSSVLFDRMGLGGGKLSQRQHYQLDM